MLGACVSLKVEAVERTKLGDPFPLKFLERRPNLQKFRRTLVRPILDVVVPVEFHPVKLRKGAFEIIFGLICTVGFFLDCF